MSVYFQTALHLCADLSDIDLQRVRPSIQRQLDKLLKSGSENLRSAVWTGETDRWKLSTVTVHPECLLSY